MAGVASKIADSGTPAPPHPSEPRLDRQRPLAARPAPVRSRPGGRQEFLARRNDRPAVRPRRVRAWRLRDHRRRVQGVHRAQHAARPHLRQARDHRCGGRAGADPTPAPDPRLGDRAPLQPDLDADIRSAYAKLCADAGLPTSPSRCAPPPPPRTCPTPASPASRKPSST